MSKWNKINNQQLVNLAKSIKDLIVHTTVLKFDLKQNKNIEDNLSVE